MSTLKDSPKVIWLVVFSVVVMGAGTAYTFWPEAEQEMPAMPESMDDVRALLESKSYKNLSSEQRRAYVIRVSELMRDSDAEQRKALRDDKDSRNAMREMFMQMMVDRSRQFAMADEAQRQQMIQEDLARMAAMRGGRGQRGGGGEGGDRGDRGDRPEPSDEEKAKRREERESRIEEWVNEGNGQDAALMREYWQAMHEARESQ